MKKIQGLLVSSLVILLGTILSGCDEEKSQTDGASVEAQPCDSSWGTLQESENKCWTKNAASNDFYLEDAINYCETLELGGNSDWVLPSKSDFESVLGNCVEDEDYQEGFWCDDCASSSKCSSIFGNNDGWYWTSTPYEYSDDYWDVDFSDGQIVNSAAENWREVLCVRRL